MNVHRILKLLFILSLLQIFTTCKEEELPTLSTSSISNITATSATGGGTITSDGRARVISRGVCWSTKPNPTIKGTFTLDGAGTGVFSSIISCLSGATTYSVRAYATNSVGTAYGDQQSFTTQGSNPIIFNPDLTYGSVTDIDGNCYKTIQIGTQIWMAENLKTTKYNDGTGIPLVTDSLTWQNLEGYDEHTQNPYVNPGYCWYGNNIDISKDTYGALYNFTAVDRGGLCPSGWHVPGMEEWEILTDCLGRIEVAGGKLKEAGFIHWKNPNSGADNSCGFTALPGGMRTPGAGFMLMGYKGSWWTGESSFRATGIAWSLSYETVTAQFMDEARANNGFSVRCIKD